MPLLISSRNPTKSVASRSILGSKVLKRIACIFAFITALYFLIPTLGDVAYSAGLTPDRLQRTSPSRSDIANGRNPLRTAKPRAAFMILVRERELHDLLASIRDLQWAFNDDIEHGYDYVILSEHPFTPYFQDKVTDFLSKRPSKPKATFGLVPKEDWAVPSHIDLEKAKVKWAKMNSGGRIPYAGSKSYRQMCRYMSGPVFHHPLLKDLDYHWRIEPGTKHFCTFNSHWKQVDGVYEWVERDPFRYMRAHKKKYGWSIMLKELRGTVMTLMAQVNKWRNENPSLIADDNAYSFVSNDGIGYNMCHFWSNFEIVDLSFVRGTAYQSFFEHLDRAGGFFYERWGDAPVRSIAAAMLLNKEEIWQVDHAGYYHPPYSYCPRTLDPGQSCACDADVNIDYAFVYSECQTRYNKVNGIDSRQVIHSLNEKNHVQESFKQGEEPYVIKPPRLASMGDE